MSTPLQIITIRAPDYATEPNISDLIAQATLEVSNCYGDLKNKAIALIVMHWVALSKRDPGGTGATGTIKSEKEGDLARSYGTSSIMATSDDYYSQTTWGLEFLRLQRESFILPRNRFVSGC